MLHPVPASHREKERMERYRIPVFFDDGVFIYVLRLALVFIRTVSFIYGLFNPVPPSVYLR
jgi:hypothetical protein